MKKKKSKMDRLQRSHQSSIYSVLDRIYNMLRSMQRKSAIDGLNSEEAHKDLDEALTNLTRLESSSALPNEDLKSAIRSIKEFKEALPPQMNSHKETEIQHYGALEIQAYLKSKGHNVQRKRCREMLLRVDSAGTASRWSRTIQRRQYNVPTANSVWHVDTHHSLARWGIVVHGAIDGYSRLIPFMRASTYNTSKAAACFFVEGVKNYGVPSRVRADNGTEYVDTGRFMVEVNGEDRGSFLTGPSVHNQRIERLWRDVYMKVIDTYYKLFLYMEEEKVLDIGNDTQKWVLQYVFTQRIDTALKEWMVIHNNHKIRTENNKTPNMLWFQSLLESDPFKFRSARNIESPPEEKIQMAIQSLNLELDDTTFLSPRPPCPLMADALQELSTIDVDKESTSHGLDIFREVMLHVLSRQ
ncbi:hypothetical protein KUTeg_004191 [Tegillarca granosa]|uniref:Integrase catalytic domain-containing protein n=1 Tax=Tegillarca granosa TaxID=220873 RepID=A0ABQ9FPC2_TEGGR|nr:hypothetical protein KUTeg_004191 [Tegillarca granosa]